MIETYLFSSCLFSAACSAVVVPGQLVSCLPASFDRSARLPAGWGTAPHHSSTVTIQKMTCMIHYEYEMLKSIALSVSISSCRPRPTPSQYKANAEKLPLQCLPNHSKQHSKRHNIFSCHYQRCIEYHHTICYLTQSYPFLPYNIKLTLATTDHDMTIPHSMQHNIK